MQKSALRFVSPTPVNGTVPPRRKPNSEARDREPGGLAAQGGWVSNDPFETLDQSPPLSAFGSP